jgi:hypothetical protein
MLLKVADARSIEARLDAGPRRYHHGDVGSLAALPPHKDRTQRSGLRTWEKLLDEHLR